MNSLLRCCIVALAAAGVGACASQGSAGYAASAPAQVPGNHVPDARYIARVEQLARRRGIDVHWVNPPLRRVTVATAGQPD